MRAPLRPIRRRRAPLAAVALAAVVALVAGVPASAAPSTPSAAAGTGDSILSPRLETLAQPGVQRRGAPTQADAVGLSETGAGSLLRNDGRLVVNVVADNPAAVAAAGQVPGAELVATLPDGVTASLALPASSLTDLAAVAGLRSAQEVLTPQIHREAAPAAPAAPSSASAAPTCATGVQSQGDAQLKAALARSTYGLDGAGVTVGVLSDSFKQDADGYAQDVATGELPGPGNPCGRTTPVQVLEDYDEAASDEGRAMVQIVHDLAPEAKLLFATAFKGDVDFANQIRALSAAGADVIVDDIGYFNEPLYQDGPIAVAVNQVHDAGVAYFSAAGNGEYRLGGKSVGSYEAQSLRPAACPALLAGLVCHDFDPGAGVVPYDQITLDGSSTLALSLGWNEPLQGVSTDLDLFLVDPNANGGSGTVVAWADGNSTMSGDPTEYLEFQNPSFNPKSYRLYVARAQGTGMPRFKFIFQSPGRFLVAVQWNADSRVGDTDVFGPTAYGHSATTKMMSIGARAYDEAGVEDFSSRGPATSCWLPATGGANPTGPKACTTKQIDVVATDGVGTTLPGFSGLNPFYGTSAAAPHAAAVAALMLQHQPCRANTEVYTAMRQTAVPISGATTAAQGKGFVNALAAVGALGSCGPYTAPAGSVYLPITPCRVIDTRAGSGGPLASGTQRAFQVSGSSPRIAAQGGRAGGCGVPAAATAVEASVSAVTPSGVGYFRAWPTGAPPPNATLLNYSTGQGTTNTGSVALPAAGLRDLTVRNVGARSHFVVDVQGYYLSAATVPLADGSVYKAITPCRVVDTRVPSSSPLGPDAQRGFQVGGAGGAFAGQGGKAGGCAIPEGARAVEASITAVEPDAIGYFRAWPSGVAAPNATFLNYARGQGSTNTGSIALRTTGTADQDLTVQNFGGTADYVIDVQGYFIGRDVDPSGSLYRPLSPCRVADTRAPSSSALTPNAQRAFQVGGAGAAFANQGGQAGGCAIPEGSTAVEASVTAVAPTGTGFFRAWPTGVAAPNATFLNYAGGRSTTNTGSVALQLAGTANADLTAKNFGATADYVIDVQGYFQPPA